MVLAGSMRVLLLFCISGLLLNHRNLIAGADISRALLPPWYTYENWNQGLMRGAVKPVPAP